MTTTTRAWWDRSHGWILGFLVGAVVGALGAGLVYVQGNERVAALQTSHQAELEDVTRLTEESRASLEAARSTEALLRARIAASAAVDHVDDANYGLAQEQLRSVGIALAQVDPVLAGVEPGALTAARESVQSALESLTLDASALRQRLVEVEQAVDALLPREPLG